VQVPLPILKFPNYIILNLFNRGLDSDVGRSHIEFRIKILTFSKCDIAGFNY